MYWRRGRFLVQRKTKNHNAFLGWNSGLTGRQEQERVGRYFVQGEGEKNKT